MKLFPIIPKAARVDPAVRAEAKRRALAFLREGDDRGPDHDAIAPDLLETALRVLGGDADARLLESMRARLLETHDADLRVDLLVALSSARAPALLPLVRDLVWSPRVTASEKAIPVDFELEDPVTRESTWAWVKRSFDRLQAELPNPSFVVTALGRFCDDAHADDIAAFFSPERVSRIDGGARLVTSAVETVRLCAARRKSQEKSEREFFERNR